MNIIIKEIIEFIILFVLAFSPIIIFFFIIFYSNKIDKNDKRI